MELLSTRGDAVLLPKSAKLTGVDGDFVLLEWILKTADEARHVSGVASVGSLARQKQKKACPLSFLDPETVRYNDGPVEIRLASNPYQLLKMVCQAYRRGKELQKDDVYRRFWDGINEKTAVERLNNLIDVDLTKALSRGGIPFTVGRHNTSLYLKKLE